MAPTLWLVRHGETEWSLSGRHTGRTDLSLTENGQRQASALVPFLREQSFEHVFCSPLKRARETCNLAGYGDHARIDPDLQEWDYGIYEGRKSAEIAEKQPDWSLWDQPVPEGESAEDLQNRASRVIRHFLTLNGDILVFAHAHILRCLIGIWANDDIRLGKNLQLDTASVSILGFHNGVRVIRKLNVTPLDPPPEQYEIAIPT